MNNAVRQEIKKSPIVVSRLYTAENQKEGTMTAEIKQEVTIKSWYPSKRVDSNLQDNVYTAQSMGFEEQPFSSTETRVAWLLVSPSATKEGVQKDIDVAFKAGACIYRILASAPILDNNQLAGIQLGYRNMDFYANNQVVRYPSKDGELGAIITDKVSNLPFYRRTFFKKTATADQDLRDGSKSYISPEIAMELQGAGSILEDQAI